MNFWQQLAADKKMILALSPMDGVTDYPFRQIVKKYGKPDLIFTEFANVEGICNGAKQILQHFDFDDSQRPLIAQVFGKNPEHFYQVAILLSQIGVDGIDINMGCPAKTVANNGSGAALIKTPDLALEIIRAVKRGVADWGKGKTIDDCPDLKEKVKSELKRRMEFFNLKEANHENLPSISVKTRVGYDADEIDNWFPYLLEEDLAAISLHGRSLKQAYSGQADWNLIAKAAAMVRDKNPEIIFLGNGDIDSYADALNKTKKYKTDGALIGRASFGDPFVFLKKQAASDEFNIFEIALEHAQLFEDTYKDQERYSFLPMRKHLAWYTKGVKDAALIRSQLVKTNSAAEVKSIFEKYQLI
jgi:tRNA-dihydrouridine synthase